MNMHKPEYNIVLTDNDRKRLEKLTNTGVASVRQVKRARIVPGLDKSGGRVPCKDSVIAERVGVSRQTVQVVKKLYFSRQGDLDAVLRRKKRGSPPVPAKVTGEVEAHIIALACSEAPLGHSRWTLRLLAEKGAGLQYVDGISHTPVARLLKKPFPSPA
jgi:hypothetical protein